MKKYNKDIYLDLINYKIKIIYLFIIITLGIMTFVGINTISYDMNYTANEILKKYNVVDFKVITPIGFEDFDEKKLTDSLKILDLEYLKYEESKIKNTNKKVALISIPKKVSKLNIIKKLENTNLENGIFIENKYKNKHKLGNKIILENGKEYTIVGFYENPEKRLKSTFFLSIYGTGNIDYTIYLNESYFKNNDAKILNIKLIDLNKITVYSKEYEENIIKYKEKLEEVLFEIDKDKIRKFKFKNLLKLKNTNLEIEKNLKALKEGKLKLENGIEKIFVEEEKLNSKKQQFLNAKKIFSENEFNIKNGLKLIEEKKKEINLKKEELILKKKELESYKKEIIEGNKKIEDGLLILKKEKEKIIKNKIKLIENEEKLEKIKNNILFRIKYEKSKKELEEYKLKLEDGFLRIKSEEKNLLLKKEEINSKYKEVEEGLLKIEDGLSKINVAEKEILYNLKKINSSKDKLILEKEKYYKDYNKNKAKILEGENEILKNKKKILGEKENFDENYNKFLNEINSNLSKLELEKDKINSIESSSFFIKSIFENKDFISYFESIKSIEIISKIFPIIFYSVVLLIITTAIMRLVEEQRYEIGTYKFLGYENKYIIKKYLVFISLPVIFGIILGVFLGIYAMPKILYIAFSAGSIETFLNLDIKISYFPIIFSIILVILFLVLSLYISLKSEIYSNVSSLLIAKVPKSGSKIILENIRFIWNRLSFSNKLTFRNIFRYKFKMIMNILGVMGCCSLIFLGFAIKNSYNQIPEKQFNEIHKYTSKINLNPYTLEKNRKDIEKKLNEFANISSNYFIAKGNDKKEYIVETYIFKENDVSKYINIDKLSNNGAIISKRILTLINKNVGDVIEFKDINNNIFKIRIDGSFENYYSNYLIMTREYFKKISAEKLDFNSYLIKEDVDFNNVDILNIEKSYEKRESFDKISESLNYIIIFLILLSAGLSIIVTYTLLEINVSERKRELSTIKVLGYFDKELLLYIYKEIIFLNILGIILGLFFGKILHYIILESMEKTSTVFVNDIYISSYIYSIILTILFTLISIILMSKKIKDVDMVESLKTE